MAVERARTQELIEWRGWVWYGQPVFGSVMDNVNGEHTRGRRVKQLALRGEPLDPSGRVRSLRVRRVPRTA